MGHLCTMKFWNLFSNGIRFFWKLLWSSHVFKQNKVKRTMSWVAPSSFPHDVRTPTSPLLMIQVHDGYPPATKKSRNLSTVLLKTHVSSCIGHCCLLESLAPGTTLPFIPEVSCLCLQGSTAIFSSCLYTCLFSTLLFGHICFFAEVIVFSEVHTTVTQLLSEILPWTPSIPSDIVNDASLHGLPFFLWNKYFLCWHLTSITCTGRVIQKACS